MGETVRGCGWRKIGGLYLVVDGPGIPCAFLPYPLERCPVCDCGIKFSRGWTWVSRSLFVTPSNICGNCPALGGCGFTGDHEKLGLVWVGEAHYKTTAAFVEEAEGQGISRRIHTIPRGFKVGETWVALAHRKAVRRVKMEQMPLPGQEVDQTLPGAVEYEHIPGVFRMFRPSRIEYIVTEEMLKDEAVQKRIEKQGLTPVVVPDEPKHWRGR